jgi:O6-methylguanine-DNA--protein-cysteine methyltransferase
VLAKPVRRREEDFLGWIKRHFADCRIIQRDDQIIQDTEMQINEYLAGARKEFSLPLDLRGTVFQRRVWHALLQIPYGTTVSYKDIAVAITIPAQYGRSVRPTTKIRYLL